MRGVNPKIGTGSKLSALAALGYLSKTNGGFYYTALKGFDNDSLVVRLSAASFVKSASMPVMNQPLHSIKQYF